MKMDINYLENLDKLKTDCLANQNIKDHFEKVKNNISPMTYSEFIDQYVIDIYKRESSSSPQLRMLNSFLRYR